MDKESVEVLRAVNLLRRLLGHEAGIANPFGWVQVAARLLEIGADMQGYPDAGAPITPAQFRALGSKLEGLARYWTRHEARTGELDAVARQVRAAVDHLSARPYPLDSARDEALRQLHDVLDTLDGLDGADGA